MRLRIGRNNGFFKGIEMRSAAACQFGVSLIAIGAFALVSTAANAEDDVSASDDNERTIIVTGASNGYVASNIVSATKTDTPLLDVPQTVNVITREQLDDQGHHSLADVLRYVPGVTVGQGEGNRDQITLRGQNTTADFFIDGVRDDVQYFRGLYNLERIEVLKGPSALIFGRGGGGGVVNRVQKSPLFEDAFAGGRASINSFGAYDFAADINQPVSGAIAARVNATYENLDNHRDYYDGERYAINPYIAARLGEDWNVGLSYEYVNDDRVLDRGIPSIASKPLTGFRDQFFGVPGVNRTTLEAHIVKLRLDGNVTDALKFSSTLLYGDYDKLYTNVFANGAVDAATNQVALSGYSDPTSRQNFIAQANLIWDVRTGSIGHKVLLGAEYGDQRSANQRSNAILSSGIIDLDAPVFPAVTFPSLSRDTVSDVEFFSAYLQDQISLSDKFDIVAGLRYDRFEIKGTDLAATPDRPFARTDTKISPRLGLIYKPQENVSIYASYSKSFKPRSGDQFLTLSSTDKDLAPEKFTSYEVGAKWDIRPDFTVTAAMFTLNRTNATTPDPANVSQTIVVGATRVKGVELAATGRILPAWQVSAGYTFQNAYLRGNDDVRLAQVPKHQVSVWNRIDVSKQFGAGLGLIHQSSQFAANRTSAATTRLPGFTRVDAALFYTVSSRIKVQLNAENILDEQYFSDAHNNNNISVGAPVNGRLSVQVKF
jgi:catecholate siderophore receptor